MGEVHRCVYTQATCVLRDLLSSSKSDSMTESRQQSNGIRKNFYDDDDEYSALPLVQRQEEEFISRCLLRARRSTSRSSASVALLSIYIVAIHLRNIKARPIFRSRALIPIRIKGQSGNKWRREQFRDSLIGFARCVCVYWMLCTHPLPLTVRSYGRQRRLQDSDVLPRRVKYRIKLFAHR